MSTDLREPSAHGGEDAYRRQRDHRDGEDEVGQRRPGPQGRDRGDGHDEAHRRRGGPHVEGGARDDRLDLEVTLGGLEVEAERDLVVALTGAVLPGAPMHGTVRLRAGERIVCGSPATGLRTYLAVRGGIATEPVVGSRSTDLLSGLGPPVVQDGDRLPIGDDHAPRVDYGVDTAPSPALPSGPAHLPVVPGPRADWFAANEWDRLTSTDWTASSRSNRIGLRLEGPGIERHDAGELASEGMVRGAVQVPPSGEPIVFLADHPVTGGYPVVAVLAAGAVDLAAQLVPGSEIRFRRC